MKPIAFRIRDFRSIHDTGLCVLSGDNITVLAGQNEAGKSAILMALRDFDLEEGVPPQTSEYWPEGRDDANPSVTIVFEIEIDGLISNLDEYDVFLPETLIQTLRAEPRLWITRDLVSGKYTIDDALLSHWAPADAAADISSSSKQDATAEENESRDSNETANSVEGVNITGHYNVVVNPARIVKKISKSLLKPEDIGRTLRNFWPLIIYFDSFEDKLPREIEIERLFDPPGSQSVPDPPVTPVTVDPAEGASQTESKQVVVAHPKQIMEPPPQSVLDFIALSKLDLERLKTHSEQDKLLGNYLNKCSASITGDFLSYWKQRVDGEETVKLQVKHHRGSDGGLKLAFYVCDTVDQYPEQRSKGFLWFLSFYLRLAGAEVRETRFKRLILVDEPGSYLHACAQLDVLRLFEKRIVKQQQIIYSTHSIHLLPSSNMHRLRIVINKRHSGTVILDKLTHPDLRGEEFADTLSPIIQSLGLDFRDALRLTKDKNLLVEGITDRIYLQAWSAKYLPALNQEYNIIPGTGAFSLITIASIFIGWGFPFQVLLDRDQQGEATKDKMIRELLINEEDIIQPRDACAIEDIFTREDFKKLLNDYDESLHPKENERPSSTVKRLGIDKAVLARTFSEKYQANKLELSDETNIRIKTLLETIRQNSSPKISRKKQRAERAKPD